MHARITDRRATLAAQLDHGRLVFADMEAQRDQAIAALAQLQRQLDALAGGLQELDALIADATEPHRAGDARPPALD